MSRFKLLVLAALVAAGLSGMALTQTFAASKVVDVDVQNAPVVIFPVSFCGGLEALDGKFSAHLTVWDNGHVKGHLNGSADVVDIFTWTKVGRASLEANGTLGTGGLPAVLQVNANVTCEGSGNVVNVHFGATVDENGNIHIH